MLLKNAGVREQLFCKAEMAKRGVAKYFDLARECWIYNSFVDVIIPVATGHTEVDAALTVAQFLVFSAPVCSNRVYMFNDVLTRHMRVTYEGLAAKEVLSKYGLDGSDCFCEDE